MSSTNAPFGLRPVYHPSGTIRPVAVALASGYATAIYQFDPVKMNANGYLNLGATTGALLGTFLGCEYVGSDGRPRYSNFWTASTATLNSADAVAYVTRDPSIVYEIQANGAVAFADISSQFNVSSAIGTTTGNAGFSLATLDTGTQTTSSTAQFRVIELATYPDNAWGDSYTIVHVQIATHQYVAVVNAF